jgi:hypothetical protein
MPAQSLLEIEVFILRGLLLLAQERTNAQARAELGPLLAELTGYGWKDEEHRVVYQCLRILGASRAKPSREELAAQATRMGHPDVDWPTYLEHEGEPIDLPALVGALRR